MSNEFCTVSVGARIPDFELSAYHKDKIVTLKRSAFRGKWLVLFFYPADFTFICPTELEELAEHYAAFKKQGAEIVSVSADTVYVHKAWHDQSPAIGKITFPMAADPKGALARMFGTYIEDGEDAGLSLRGMFIIDPDGVLRAMEIHDNSIGRSAKELLRKLQAAKFVREHGGQVCPASWEPGAKTLRPGLGLVGKI
jgi:peroxiredoxin (alkyl hydroperoxide reductase subunit C)